MDLKLVEERVQVLAIKEEDITPEGLAIANVYLSCQGDIDAVVAQTGIDKVAVVKQLGRKEVKKYIDTVYMDTGYRNRYRLSSVLDSVINRKLVEMEEAEIGSSKDISELVMLAHKMRIEELELQLKIEKMQQTRDLAMVREKSKVVNTGPVINIQDNSHGGSNYGALLTQLMESS